MINKTANSALPALLAAVLIACNGSPAQESPPFKPEPSNSGAAPAAGRDHPAPSPAASPAAVSRGLPSDAVHVEPAVVIDYAGGERPMAAMTLFIPVSWTTEGGVDWGMQHMCTNGYAINWRATSPDGSMSVRIVPQQGWEGSNFGAPPSRPGCRNAPYTDVRQYLDGLVQQLHPGARTLDFRRRPDVEEEFAGFSHTLPSPMSDIRQWVEAGEILFGFQQGGREMRGTVAAAVHFTVSSMDASMVGMDLMQSISAHAFHGWAVTAPHGQLDFRFFEALRRSARSDPHWQALIDRHNIEIGKAAARGAAERSQIISQSAADISRIRQQAWQNQQESADRRAAQFSRYIRGVEQYQDRHAPGGSVELSAHYRQAWRLDNGSYVLTNDVNFEPWRDLRIGGERLDPIP